MFRHAHRETKDRVSVQEEAPGMVKRSLRWHCTKSSDCQVRVRGAPFHAFTCFSCWGVVKHSFIHSFNTFYLRLYGIGYIVKDHSDSERGNLGYSFQIAARVLYKHHPTDRITHTKVFVTPVVEK